MLKIRKPYLTSIITASISIIFISYLYFEKEFRFIIAIAVVLGAITLFWMMRLFFLKIKDHPASGINLKLTLAFIILSTIPLALVLYFSNQVINQFIQEKLEQPFGNRIDTIRDLSLRKIYKNNFITYVNSEGFRENLELASKNHYNVLFDSSVHFIIKFKQNKMEFLYISQEDFLKFYEIKKNFKQEIFKLFNRISLEEERNLNNHVELVLIETQLNLLFHLKKSLSDRNAYILTGNYISSTDLEIANKIKELSFIYESNKLTKEQAVVDFNKIILSIGLPTVFISVILSFIIAKSILKPVERLILGTQEIAKGNLNYRILEKDKGDFGVLIKSFNTMTEELIKNKNQLYKVEKIAAWREVARKLAHEIKNPLTPIKLAAERIKRQYEFANERFPVILNDGTNIIISEVDRLRKLVNEFSDFARSPRIEKTESDILTDTDKIIMYYKNSFSYVDFNVKSNGLNRNQSVEYDQEKIKQVFINIIDNSIESNKNNNNLKITIQLENTSDNLIISIIDNGVGIKPEDLDYIFDPYFTNKEEGSGLGLAIVRNIIEEHKGSIDVKSQFGHGATFTITLPL